MLSLFYQWVDLFWIPVGLLVARRGQALLTTGFILACVVALRMQIELIAGIRPHIRDGAGVLGFIETGIYERGLIVYGLLIALFLILVRFSPGTRGVVFMAASLSIFIIGFCASTLIMVL